MPSWKKVITSGSNAALNHITSSGNISGSATSTGSFGQLDLLSKGSLRINQGGRGDEGSGNNNGITLFQSTTFTGNLTTTANLFSRIFDDNKLVLANHFNNAGGGISLRTMAGGSQNSAIDIAGNTGITTINKGLVVRDSATINTDLIVTGSISGSSSSTGSFSRAEIAGTGKFGKIGINVSNPGEALEINAGKLKFSGHASGFGAGMIGMTSNFLALVGGSNGIVINGDSNGLDKNSFTFTAAKISGSSTSTGSFGRLELGQSNGAPMAVYGNVGTAGIRLENYKGYLEIDPHTSTVNITSNKNEIQFQNRIGARFGITGYSTSDLVFFTNSGNTTHATFSPTTGTSFTQNITGSGNLEIAGNISGSSTSTGSFGMGYFNQLGILNKNPSIQTSDADDLVIGDGASGVSRGITIFTSAGNSLGSIRFSDDTSGSSRRRGEIRYDHADDTLTLAASKTEVLEITSGGGLEVLTGNISGSSTSTGSFGTLETHANSSSSFGGRLKITGDIIPENDNKWRLGVLAGFGAWKEIHSYQLNLNNGTITGQNGGDIHLKAGSGPTGQLFLARSGGGNGVGVHTNSPNSNTFHVAASGGIFSENNISGSAGSTGSFGSVHTSGQIGIQTTAPKKALTVKASGNDDGIALLASNGQFAALLHQQDNDAGMLRLHDDSSTTKIAFNADDGADSFINNGGSFGIGTTSPDGLVHAFSGNASQTANAAANQLIAENNTNAGVSILSGTSHSGAIYFGDSGNAKIGTIIYDHGDEQLRIGVNDAVILTLTDSKISGSSTSTGSFGKLSVGSGNITTSGNMVLDADGAQIRLQDGGTEFGRISRVSSDLVIKSISNNNDILFKGVDGGGTITALQLDMSEGGNAIFSGNATVPGTLAVDTNTLYVDSSANKVGIKRIDPQFELDVIGDIRATGDVIAKRYVISSSVSHITSSFSSGSTIFGDTIADTHRFTGSLSVTGSGDKVFEVASFSGAVPRFRIDNDATNTIGINTTPSTGLVAIRSTGNDANQLSFLNGAGTHTGGFYDAGGRLILQLKNSSGATKVNIEPGGDSYFNGGNVGIGITSPEGLLHIFTADASIAPNVDADELVVENSGNAGISILSGNTSNGAIYFGDAQDNNIGMIDYDHALNKISLTAGATTLPVFSVTSNTAEFGPTVLKVSGSSTSTGSFGSLVISDAIQGGGNVKGGDFQISANDLVVDGLANATERGLVIKHSGMTSNTVSLVQDANNSRGELNTKNRSLFIQAGTDGFGSGERFRILVNQIASQDILNDGTVLFPVANQKISGSSSSTGSFGHLFIGHKTGNGHAKIRLSAEADTSGERAIEFFEGSFNRWRIANRGANGNFNIERSTDGTTFESTPVLSIEKSSGNVEFPVANQKISGSATSTGSFGRIDVAGKLFVGGSEVGAGGGGGSADNLGNHTATQDLDLNSKSIKNIIHITGSGNISGSTTTTASFGSLQLHGKTIHTTKASKVGLGTTNPLGNKLHIHVGDSGTDTVTTNSSLVIESNTNNFIQMLNPNGNNSGIIFGEHNDIDIASILHDGGDNSLRFNVAAAERIRINGSGNVGIGTTSPSKTFHVYANVSSDYAALVENDQATSGHGLQIHSDGNGSGTILFDVDAAGSSRFRVRGDGSVLVGFTTSQAEKLAVNGDFRATGNISGSSTSTGSFGHVMQDGKGLPPQFTTGSSIFIGENAGASDDGSNNRNIGIGKNALDAATTGHLNIAIGDDALTDVTTGNHNVAIGFESQKDTTGGNNTSVGYNSLEFNTSGNNNVAIGYAAAGGFTYSGADNVAIGFAALGGNNVSGDFNIAIGKQALYANTTADDNLAIGDFALTSVGTDANSSRNLAIGSEALRHIVYTAGSSGFNNTALGWNAGTRFGDNAGNLTSASYGVYIGHTTYPLENNSYNEILIGSQVRGKGSNTATIGDGNITDIYLSQDQGATVHTGNVSGSATSTGSFGRVFSADDIELKGNAVIFNISDGFVTNAGGAMTIQGTGNVVLDAGAGADEVTLTTTSLTTTVPFTGSSATFSDNVEIISSNASNTKLLIENNHASANALLQIDSSNDRDSVIQLLENGTAKWDIRNDGNDSDKLKISDDGLVRVTLDQSGQFGIGTTSPQKDLHLHQNNSNTLFEALTIRTNSAGEGLTLGINSTNDGFITSQVGTALRLAGDSQSYATGHLLIYSGSGDIEAVKGNISGSSTSTGSFGKLLGDGSDLTGITSFAGSAGTETSFSGSAASTGSFGAIGILTPPTKPFHINSSGVHRPMLIKSTGDQNTFIVMDSNRSGAASFTGGIVGKWNGTEVSSIYFRTGADTTNKDDGYISFQTAGDGSASERMIITTGGKVGIGGQSHANVDGLLHVHTGTAGSVTSPAVADDLVVENSDHAGISILSPDDKFGTLGFGSPSDSIAAMVRFDEANKRMIIGTVEGTSAGNIRFVVGNETTAAEIDSSKNLTLFGNISGSSTSTGSFGSLVVADKVQGDLTVVGNVVAEQYIISSSVTHLTQSFSSGSTIFGDTSDDTHRFTGSLNVDGNIQSTSGDNLSIGTSWSPAGTYGVGRFHGAHNGGGTRVMFSNANSSVRYGIVMHGSDTGTADKLGIGLLLNENATFANASPAMTIDSSKNIGMGTQSPSTKLHVFSSGNGGLEIDATGGSPTLFFDIPGNEQGRIYFQEDDTLLGGIVYETTSTDYLSFRVGGSSANVERLRITGDNKISGSATSTGSFGALSIPGQATIGSVVEASSIMYKENITPIDSPLEKITKLRGVEFDYKNTNEHSIGMIAEEVNDIFPELVAKDDKGDITAMSYTRMTAVLLEAVKELTEEVRELKAKNNYTKQKGKN